MTPTIRFCGRLWWLNRGPPGPICSTARAERHSAHDGYVNGDGQGQLGPPRNLAAGPGVLIAVAHGRRGSHPSPGLARKAQRDSGTEVPRVHHHPRPGFARSTKTDRVRTDRDRRYALDSRASGPGPCQVVVPGPEQAPCAAAEGTVRTVVRGGTGRGPLARGAARSGPSGPDRRTTACRNRLPASGPSPGVGRAGARELDPAVPDPVPRRIRPRAGQDRKCARRSDVRTVKRCTRDVSVRCGVQ